MGHFKPQPLTVDGIRWTLTPETKELFERNRDTLLRLNPERCNHLRSVRLSESHWTTLPAADGFPALVSFSGRGEICAHDDLEAPVQAQEEWYRNLEQEKRVQCLFLGFGAGHLNGLLLDDLERFENLVIIEPNAETLAVACATYDLSALARSDHVRFWIPEDGFEAAVWIAEWIREIGVESSAGISLYLHPDFVRMAPEFLWLLAEHLPREHERVLGTERFQGMADAIRGRYAVPTGWSENWEAALWSPGIGAFEGIGKGAPAVIVGGGALDETERRILTEAHQQGHVVLADAQTHAETGLEANVLVCGNQDPVPQVAEPDCCRVASVGAVCSKPYTRISPVFWAEPSGSFRHTLPSHSTPQLLAEKGILLTGNGPMGTTLDLAFHLGCSPLILVGVKKRRDSERNVPDLSWIGIRKQIRSMDREVLVLSDAAAETLPEAKRTSADEIEKVLQKARRISLGREVLERFRRSPVLPAADRPIDRSLHLDGKEIIDRNGAFRVAPEPRILETVFAHNLQALEQRLPHVARAVRERLRRKVGTESYHMGTGTDGYPRLEIRPQLGNAVVVPCHGTPWDIVAEAQLWKRLYLGCANIILGTGLAFSLEAVLERHRGRILFWEPITDRFLAAMHLRNLVPLFDRPNIEWLVGAGAREVVDHLVTNHTADLFNLPADWSPLIEPGLRSSYVTHTRDLQSELRQRSVDIRRIHIGYREVVTLRARRCLKNPVRLLPAVSIDELKGVFKGVPAIVVSAGPSLDETADLLNEVQDRALIFAVDTAYRHLQPRNIDRHFVVSIDPKEESTLHFRDRPPREEDILIATSGTPGDIWDLFHGPKLVGEFPNPLAEWFAEVLGYTLHALWSGSSVSISALGVAHALGCTPLILVGQDLAVLPDRTHASDTIYPETVERKRTVEEFEVPAVGGGTVRTTQSLLNIKQNLEHQIRWHGLRVINASAFGARIAGTEEKPFREVLAGLEDRRVPVFERVRDLAEKIPADRPQRLMKALESWHAELRDCGEKVNRLLDQAVSLKKEILRGDYPRDCTSRSQALRRAVVATGLDRPTLQRLEDLIYDASARYVMLDARIRRAPDTRKHLKWDVDRTIPFLEALKSAITTAGGEVGSIMKELGKSQA